MPSVSDQINLAVRNVTASVQAAIVATAKAQHAQIMRTDPQPLNFVRHVDGVEGAPEEAVRADGVIVYDYNRLDVVAGLALAMLRDASPVGNAGDPHPGLYRDSHRLFVDGKPVPSLDDWQPGQEISISNTTEYSRVIELGQRGGHAIKFSMPAHVYEKVAQALRRSPSVKNAADIQFTYRAVIEGAQVDQLTAGATPLAHGAKGRFTPRGGVRAHNKAEVRWPTITINPAGSFNSRAGLS